MATADEIRRELKTLVDAKSQLLRLLADDKDIFNFGTKYQDWYSRAYKLVQALGPDRLAEFVSYYLIDPKRKMTDAGNYVIQDYVKAMRARTDEDDEPLWDTHTVTGLRFLNQVQIMTSLESRIDSVLQDVTGHLFAELQDAELKAAIQLKKINFRAAGALAGVVLERHLQRVAANHGKLPNKKNPTIADLNDPLKQAAVYDVTTWRKIQLLADIRNICAHSKGIDPTTDQVDELITGTNILIKTIF